MPLTSLKFRPGINREITSYSNEGGFFDCEKVRFYSPFPEKIGGWVKQSDNTYQGTARALHNWIAIDGSNYMGVGTQLKYYIEEGGSFSDITPIRKASTNSVTFAVADGSSNVTVTDSSHGAVVNDFVTFAGAVSLGGLITAEVLNQEYQIASIADANSFVIVAKDTSGNTVTANSSDTGNGGSGGDASYQVNVGLDTAVGGNGWGAGGFSGVNADLSTFGWGDPADSGTTATIRSWSHDNFGEDLLINPRDGGIFYWDKTNGTGTKAVALSSLAGASNTPTVAKQVMVSDIDRHFIAFGANTLGTTVQDPLLIRFGSQESLTDFTPTATNTAGDLRLSSGSSFVQAVETKQQILIFTDRSLFSMRFIGPPFTFGLQELSKNITIISPKAAVAVDESVLWMGQNSFYSYAGGVAQQIPCSVRDKVFLDFNFEESDKVHAGVNSEFGEILWFYPTKNSTEIDSYVAYNYIEKVWYYGTLARQAWLDRGIRTLPMATGGQYLYNHETGYDDDGSAMTSFIETAPIDIGEGDKFVFLKRVIPDITFNGSTSTNPDVAFTMKVKNFPGSSFSQTQGGNAQRSSTSPVEQFTEKLDYRLRGRAFALRIDSTSLGTKYKLGTPRVDIRPDGRR